MGPAPLMSSYCWIDRIATLHCSMILSARRSSWIPCRLSPDLDRRFLMECKICYADLSILVCNSSYLASFYSSSCSTRPSSSIWRSKLSSICFMVLAGCSTGVGRRFGDRMTSVLSPSEPLEVTWLKVTLLSQPLPWNCFLGGVFSGDL